jgi:hypothetical protein
LEFFGAHVNESVEFSVALLIAQQRIC